MDVVYSEHAEKRMKQRGITTLEVEHVLAYPAFIRKSFSGRKEAVGEVNGRQIKLVFAEKKNYINVITVI